jgi:tetratricopeptide (TPR) repeat protein
MLGERMRTARTVLFSGAFALQTVCGTIFADNPKVGVKEALLLKKITEYWKEGHFEDAKAQLKTYLTTYPTSPYLNEVYAMLGDLYLQEGKVDLALDCYQKIQSSECQELTALHRAEALYQLGRYDELTQWAEAKKDLLYSQERTHLLLADSYYRKALKESDPTTVQANARKAIDEFQLVKNLDKEWNLVVAYLHALCGEKTKAADLYLSLANDFADKKDHLYLQAAFLLESTDVNKALSLLHEVASQPGSLQKDATFNELVLLFREKRYAEYLQRQKDTASIIDQSQPTFFYYTGIALFEQGNFEEASQYLHQFITSSPSSKEDLRTSLRSLFYCGYKTQNPDLIKTSLEVWRKDLPLDNDYLEGLRAIATGYLKKENYQAAREALNEIVESFPSDPMHENALWDYSQTLLCLNDFDNAKTALQSFVTTYSESPHIANAWQNLIYVSSELLKNSEQTKRDFLNRDLAGYLREALKNPSLFDEDSLRSYRLHLTHLLFDIGELSEASNMAEAYLNLYSGHDTAREVRFMQITCNMNLGLPVGSLITPMEKALENESDPALQMQLHLQLFNAYLAEGSFDGALQHLVAVYKNGSLPIKSENLLWLAEKMYEQKDLSLAKEIYHKALTENNTLEPLVYEESIIKLKNLYVDAGETESARQLLMELAQQQKLKSDVNWRYLRKTQYELAELQESMGHLQEALKTYEELIGDDPFSKTSYYLRAAMLKKAKLQLTLLPSSEKHEGSPELLSILGSFKDLQIARSVESEPVHLEAALEYATTRCSLLPESEQSKRMIFYLQRIEEDFLSDASDIGSTYLKERQQWPEQNRVIEQYLKYIDAERKRLKSLEAQKSGDTERYMSLKATAKEELQALLSELDSSALLQKRVSHSLAALD